MELENLTYDAQFLFISMMKSAILIKESGKDKKFFVDFAYETWDSMEMSDLDDLKNIIATHMKKCIDPYIEARIKSRNDNVR